jgi:hypothetical protein
MATPSNGGETDRACCTAQQKAARALHRTAPDTTAVLFGSAAVQSIDEPGNGCIQIKQYRHPATIPALFGGQGDGHTGMRPLKLTALRQRAAAKA